MGPAEIVASLKELCAEKGPRLGTEDIVAPYNDMRHREIPIFITADTLLHLYHVQFDETLKDIEERQFYPDMVALTKSLLARLITHIAVSRGC